MRLARIRRAPQAQVELAAAVDLDGSPGLVSLRTVPGGEAADPVAALTAPGLDALEEELARLTRSEVLRPNDVVFEPPVARCSKICCLALNYAAHAAESSFEVPPDPVLFFKPPSALVGHGADVCPPARTSHVEHEVELALVVGRRCRDVPADDWRSVVAGYTVINDMTARDLQLTNIDRNQPWDQAKAFDTFAPLGPYLVTPDEVPDPQDLRMVLTVGDEVRQEASTSQMVHDLSRILSDLSDGMTLEPGDVIATGTTAGIAPVRDGEVMHATIERIGTLTNRVTWA